MKLTKSIVGMLLVIGASVAFADPKKIDFIEHVAKQIQYAEDEQRSVWPNFHPAKTASVILMYDYEEGDDEGKISAYALNFKPGKLPWIPLNSYNVPVYFLQDAKALLENASGDGVFMQIDDQKSFVDFEVLKMLIAQENLRSKFMTKRAENYFVHESSFDPHHSGYLNIPYDAYNKTDLLKLFYLEDAALTKAQQSDSNLAEEALRDAVAIHQYRNQLSNNKTKLFENGNEIIHGTPYFIAWTSRQLNEDDYRKFTQRTGCAPLNSLYGTREIADCIKNGFPAFASAVYGHALDKKMTGQLSWKKEVEKEFKSISQIAMDYYHFDNDQAKKMTEKAINNPSYNYDRISRIIDHVMLPYLEKMDVATKKYKEMQGIELRLPPEWVVMLKFATFFEDDVYVAEYDVNSNMILFENVNFIGDDFDMPDVVFDHMPYVSGHAVFKDFDIDEKNSYAALKISDNAKLTIDGVTITAGDFVRQHKTQSFKNLILDDTHLHLPVKNVGTLDASQGFLKLIYTMGPFNSKKKILNLSGYLS